MPGQCRRRRTHQQLANASPSDESLSFFKNPSKTCRLRRRFPQFLLAHRFAIFRTSWWSRRFFYLPALPSTRLPDGWRSARHKRILFACRVGANAIFPSRATPTSLSLQTGLCPIFDPSCTSLGTPLSTLWMQCLYAVLASSFYTLPRPVFVYHFTGHSPSPSIIMNDESRFAAVHAKSWRQNGYAHSFPFRRNLTKEGTAKKRRWPKPTPPGRKIHPRASFIDDVVRDRGSLPHHICRQNAAFCMAQETAARLCIPVTAFRPESETDTAI